MKSVSVLLHGGGPMAGAAGETGSTMYDIIGDHLPALWAMSIALTGGALLLRFGRGPRLAALRRLPLRHGTTAWLLALAAAAHAGLMVGASGGWRLLFAGSVAAAVVVVVHMADGRPWRGAATLLLLGSLLGYWIELLRGHPVDQIGITVKAMELFTLYLVMLPRDLQRIAIRRAAATTALMALALINTTAVWVAAFRSAAGDTNVLDHHGHGVTPGMVMNVGAGRVASAAGRTAVERLWRDTTDFVSRYADISAAAADGYRVEDVFGIDFHAPNPIYQRDGTVLDPTRPENLVYGMGPDGPVLLGVMFETEGLDHDPPATGGALLQWHRHEQICFSLAPPGIAGLVDPFGSCPIGSLTLSTTNSMMHVWTLPGAPTRFGDLDDAWKKAYLDNLVG
ncbi:MAG: hypothetical protein ACRDWH_01010 [Acidimicrobiia bacterium]